MLKNIFKIYLFSSFTSVKCIQIKYHKNRNTVTDVENKRLPGRKWGEGVNWKTGCVLTYTHYSIKQITNKDVLSSTGNSSQHSVKNDMGKESDNE